MVIAFKAPAKKTRYSFSNISRGDVNVVDDVMSERSM